MHPIRPGAGAVEKLHVTGLLRTGQGVRRRRRNEQWRRSGPSPHLRSPPHPPGIQGSRIEATIPDQASGGGNFLPSPSPHQPERSPRWAIGTSAGNSTVWVQTALPQIDEPINHWSEAQVQAWIPLYPLPPLLARNGGGEGVEGVPTGRRMRTGCRAVAAAQRQNTPKLITDRYRQFVVGDGGGGGSSHKLSGALCFPLIYLPACGPPPFQRDGESNTKARVGGFSNIILHFSPPSYLGFGLAFCLPPPSRPNGNGQPVSKVLLFIGASAVPKLEAPPPVCVRGYTCVPCQSGRWVENRRST